MIVNKIFEGLKKLNFCNNKNDINFYQIKKFKYAYVIYDLNHRSNVDEILKFYKKKISFMLEDVVLGNI